MSCTISDSLHDGTGAAVAGAPILSWPVPDAGLILNGSPAVPPYPNTVTDVSGAFTLVLPDATNAVPSSVQWAVRIDDSVYYGPPITGTFTVAQLLSRGWVATDGSNLPVSAAAGVGLSVAFGQVVIRAIPGPEGPQGPAGGSAGAAATTTVLGSVQVRTAPASGNPIALTVPDIGAASGVAPLDSNKHLPDANLPAATTAALGGVEIRTAPVSGNPIALTAADLNAASGVAPLDTTSKVPIVNLPNRDYTDLIESYGAGTGGDITTPLSNAINAGNAGTIGDIFIASGSYTCGNLPDMTRGFRIRGVPGYGTTITHTGTGNLFNIRSSCGFMVIEDLKLVPNANTRALVYWSGSNGAMTRISAWGTGVATAATGFEFGEDLGGVGGGYYNTFTKLRTYQLGQGFVSHGNLNRSKTLSQNEFIGCQATYSTAGFGIWAASTAYTVGQAIVPDGADWPSSNTGHVWLCTTAGTSGATSPAWGTKSGSAAVGGQFTDGTVTWTETPWDYVRFAATPWVASRVYPAGAIVGPSKNNRNGHVYTTTAGGTAGAIEPTWLSGTGSTVTDGTITWTEASVTKAGNGSGAGMLTMIGSRGNIWLGGDWEQNDGYGAVFEDLSAQTYGTWIEANGKKFPTIPSTGIHYRSTLLADTGSLYTSMMFLPSMDSGSGPNDNYSAGHLYSGSIVTLQEQTGSPTDLWNTTTHSTSSGDSTYTTTATLSSYDGEILRASASAGAVTLTLPTTSTLQPGRRYTFIRTDSTTNAITIAGNTGQLITVPGTGTASNYTLPTGQYHSVSMAWNVGLGVWFITATS